jgi:hypothetical protein
VGEWQGWPLRGEGRAGDAGGGFTQPGNFVHFKLPRAAEFHESARHEHFREISTGRSGQIARNSLAAIPTALPSRSSPLRGANPRRAHPARRRLPAPTQPQRRNLPRIPPLVPIAVLLVAIWALTGAGYFWPVWPIGAMLISGFKHHGCRPAITRRG